MPTNGAPRCPYLQGGCIAQREYKKGKGCFHPNERMQKMQADRMNGVRQQERTHTLICYINVTLCIECTRRGMKPRHKALLSYKCGGTTQGGAGTTFTASDPYRGPDCSCNNTARRGKCSCEGRNATTSWKFSCKSIR